MSRYAKYSDFVTEIAQEAGEAGSDLDALLLNLLKSVVDQLNTVRTSCREASVTVPIVANVASYAFSAFAPDFQEPVHSQTGLYMADSQGVVFIPIVRTRQEFLQCFTSTARGKPLIARLFAGLLIVGPTPDQAYAPILEYFKILASPTAGGTVLIPDQYLSWVRMEVLNRLEAYHESDTFAEKQQVFGGVRLAVLKAMERDYQQNVLPGEIEMLDSD